jgi:hypothetical protein
VKLRPLSEGLRNALSRVGLPSVALPASGEGRSRRDNIGQLLLGQFSEPAFSLAVGLVGCLVAVNRDPDLDLFWLHLADHSSESGACFGQRNRQTGKCEIS